MAQFTTLYSGSSGNCAVVSEGKKALMIDIGKSTRKTLSGLEEINMGVNNLCGILITHEHTDHIMGLKIFLKYHNVPVFSTENTIKYLLKKKLAPHTANFVAINNSAHNISGFNVTCFNTSHDAAESCGFRITTPKGRVIALATDLGYVTQSVYDNLIGADLVALEANYDKNMLINGNYPQYLKHRILSQKGHLCNEESAQTVLKLMQNGCKKFMLCHLSNENNSVHCVTQTLKNTLMQNNYIPHKECIIHIAKRNEVSSALQI